jgi:hypothetical protein
VPSEYTTINAAIDAAAFGDTVLVAPGTYYGEIRPYEWLNGTFLTAAVVFFKDGLTVRSEGGSDVTTLDIAGVSGAPRMVIAASLMGSTENRIEGFTIMDTQGGGRGLETGQVGGVAVRECRFSGFTIADTGGAVRFVDTDLIIEECEFADCTAEAGGAFWGFRSGLLMRGCRVENCGSIGVRLLGEYSSRTVEIADCTFVENYATGALGGVSISRFKNATVEGCWFEGNVAMDGSAGALSVVETPCNVVANVFLSNHVGGVGEGGAMTIRTAPNAVVASNTFYGNSQAQPLAQGSAISIGSSFVSLNNNIIAGSVGGSAVEHESSGETVSSCNVFWNNAGGNTSGFAMGPTDRIVDPQFCDIESDDLYLMQDSPCLPEYSEGCGLIGAFGQGCGTVAVEETSWGAIKARYLGTLGGRDHE